jgi:hypothetical protein
MSSDDEGEYGQNARNMAIILGVIVLVIFAAIFIPPLANPVHEQFQNSASVTSPYGFTVTISLNTSTVATTGVSISGSLYNTGSEILNATAANEWAVTPADLWTPVCTNGWPIGVGVMQGYFTADNYTLGTFVVLPRPLVACPVLASTPGFFLIQPHSLEAIVRLGSSLAEWKLSSTLTYGKQLGGTAPVGVYTAVAADEWGDVAIVHFRL